MRKKVSIGITIALMAASAAGSISFGYTLAMDKFNSKITDYNERVSMYGKLSEMDQSLRQYYAHAIDEQALQDGICSGYISGLNDPQVKYYTAQEYDEYLNTETPSKTISSKTFGENDKNVVIKVSGFNDRTAEEFEQEVNLAMAFKTPQNIIIDLRGCTGIDIEQTAKMLDLFIYKEDLIFSIDSNAKTELLYTADEICYKDITTAIVIDGETSGSAELFASAMLEFGKAKVVGQTTVGNVTKNKFIKLNDGSAISIPIEDYVTKSQKIFSGKGISPEKFVSMSAEQRQLYLIDKLSPQDDPQINAAVLLLEKENTSPTQVLGENIVGKLQEQASSEQDVESDQSVSDTDNDVSKSNTSEN